MARKLTMLDTFIYDFFISPAAATVFSKNLRASVLPNILFSSLFFFLNEHMEVLYALPLVHFLICSG